jgi:hypothetical protein
MLVVGSLRGGQVVRLHWVTQLILYLAAIGIGADTVLAAHAFRIAHQAIESLVGLHTNTPSPWIRTAGWLLLNVSRVIAYVGAAAMVEMLFRIWRRLRIQNLSAGEVR